jgi:hypothetical protein
MKPNLINEGVKYGAICGLLAILITYCSWAMGINTFMSVSLYSKFVPYMLVIILLAGFSLRKQNGGFLSFAQALKFTFLAYVIAELLFAASNYVLFNLVDTTLAGEVTTRSIEGARKFMEKMGTPEAKIEESIKEMQNKGNAMSFGKILLGMGIYLVWDFVMSLLISLVIRKEEKFSD